jgi:hypothetical protein
MAMATRSLERLTQSVGSWQENPRLSGEHAHCVSSWRA